MSEKQIWLNAFRLVIIIIVVSALFMFPPVKQLSWLPSYPHAQNVYAANETYKWFATNGYADGFIRSDYQIGYSPMYGDFDIFITEPDMQTEFPGDYTVQDMAVKVVTNTLTTDTYIVSRVNSANGTLTVTIPAGESGIFKDTTHSDSVSAGDLFNWMITMDDTTDLEISYISCSYTGQFPIIAGCRAATTLNSIIDNGTTYMNPSGYMLAVASSNTGMQFYTFTDTTLSGMRFYVNSNTLTENATVTLDVNGVTGNQTLIIPGAGTGAYQDDANTDTLTAGDYWYYKAVVPFGGSSAKVQPSQVTSSANVQMLGPQYPQPDSYAYNSRYYWGLHGLLTAETSTENNTAQWMPNDYTVSHLWCYVTYNNLDSTSNITFRINGADANLVLSIGTDETGLFTDLVNSDSISEDDLVDFELDTYASSSGTIKISAIGIELTPSAEEGAGVSAPTVTTQNATSIEETTATGNGNITATGGENCTERGTAYSTNSGWPYSSNITSSGSYSTGNFTSSLTPLTPGELYYASAFAGNSAGYGHGDEVTFLTKPNGATSFSDTSTTNTSISLSWTNGSGMDYVEIRYQTGSYVSDNASGTLGYWGSGSSTTVSGLSENTTYYFSIYTHVTEGSLWNTADTVGQDTATASNPVTGSMSGVFPGILNSIAVSSLIVFIIMMIAGLSQIYPIFHKGYKVINNVKR